MHIVTLLNNFYILSDYYNTNKYKTITSIDYNDNNQTYPNTYYLLYYIIKNNIIDRV